MLRANFFRSVFTPLICCAALLASVVVVRAAAPVSCECTYQVHFGLAYTYDCIATCDDESQVETTQNVVINAGEGKPEAKTAATAGCMADETLCP